MVFKLFFTFFRIGFFAIGGAYSFLPLIERETVQRYGWLTSAEFLDIAGVSAIFPGAISIKYATYVGYRVAGMPGVIAANIGNLTAPVLFITLAGFFYKKYRDYAAVGSAFSMIQIAVFAMIIATAFQLMGLKNLTEPRTVLLAFFFGVLFFSGRVHPAFIIIGAGLLGAVLGGV